MTLARSRITMTCGDCPIADQCDQGCIKDLAPVAPANGVPMNERVVASKAPIPVDVEAGKTYWWCTCGRSAKQPFCDGSHKGTGLTPLSWTAPQSKRVFFCACKASKHEPLCDGSHKAL